MNSKLKYYLGLDLGISSVGWAIMAEDPKTAKHTLYDFGVRLFDVPENRDKQSNASLRRDLRSNRRLIRRRKHRILMLKRFLSRIKFLTEDQFQTEFNLKSTNKLIKKDGRWTTETGYYNTYVLKVKGLTEKLDKPELYSVLLNYAKKRGYLNKFAIENDKKLTKTEQSNQNKAIEEADNLVKNYDDSIAKAIVYDKRFAFVKNVKDPKTKILIANNKSELVEFQGKMINRYLLEKISAKEAENAKTSQFNWLFARRDYRKELQNLLLYQSQFHPELNTNNCDQIIDIIFQTRDFEMGAKCRDCIKNMIDKTEDYIANTNNIRNCKRLDCSNFGNFWDLKGKCHFYPEERRQTKASVTYIIFYFINELSKIWSFLEQRKNSKLKFTAADKNEVLSSLFFNEWKTHAQALKIIQQKISETSIWRDYGDKNYFDKKKYPIWKEDTKDEQTGLSFKKPILLQACSKIPALTSQLKQIELTSNKVFNWEQNIIEKIGETCSLWKTPIRREYALKKLFLSKNIGLNKEEFALLLKELKEIEASPGNASAKYMQEAIRDYFDKGTLYGDFAWNFQKNHNTIKNKIVKNQTIFAHFIDKDMMSNPVVMRAISQTRKILKALHQNIQFESIVVEVARDLYSTPEQRNAIEKININNYNEKKRIIERLKKRGFENITKRKILEYSLWEQQKGICIYSGKPIDFNPSPNVVWEIDHIIPQSLCQNDTATNKVLVLRTENQSKGKKIPYWWLQGKNWSDFSSRVKSLKLPKVKTNLLLAKTVEEAIEAFSSRNLNDTRYISKWISNYIKSEISHFNLPTKVFVVPGALVSHLRRSWLRQSAWGLYQKVRDITPYHHAIDAIVICQFKKQMDIQLAVDLLKLNQIRWKNISESEKKAEEKQFLEVSQKTANILEKAFGKQDVDEYSKKIKEASRKTFLMFDFYISNLKEEVEKRIPVKLKKVDCECRKRSISSLSTPSPVDNCRICYGSKKIPRYDRILNVDEFYNENSELSNSIYINFRYPHISHMINHKVPKRINSSEKIGFFFTGYTKTKKMIFEKAKNKLFRIWFKNRKLKLEDLNLKLDFKYVKEKDLQSWLNEFSSENRDFLVKTSKTGDLLGVIPISRFFGLEIKKDKLVWLTNKTAQEYAKKNIIHKSLHKILIPNNLVEYYDPKLRKNIIKVFKSRKDKDKAYLHINGLMKTDEKTIFGFKNSTETLKRISNDSLKIIRVNLLGDLLTKKNIFTSIKR